MQDKLALPIGVTSYKEVCDGYYYADKTLLIKDFLDEQVKIALFTRPRRFGKTLNMDMLRTFFEKTDENTSRYFVNKKIWQQGEKYTQHQGRYPVIFISLKDVKASSWQDALDILKYTIVTEYSRHAELEKSSRISLADTAFYRRIITNTASNVDYMFSIQALSRMLHSYYGEQAIIIIDEYDTPIQEGYINRYYKQVVEFIRNFFSSALKDNQHMKFGILTGILRIAKESIFSGLNNIRIYSVLDNKFSAYFGFVSEEIQQMASYYNAVDKLQELREWYDGYKFGRTDIYNPWSVLYYFSSEHQAMPFWVQTSGNAVIREILQSLNGAVCDNLRALLDGTAIESGIETNIIYPSLKDLQNNIFGFLLMTGYLKSTETSVNKNGVYVCKLEIPNKEIRSIYFNEILSLLNQNADLKLLAQTALEQIECQKYDTELLRQGVEMVYKYGIAFCGKDVEIVTN